MNTQESLQWLIDRAEVEQVGILYGRANDDRDEKQPLWDQCLAEDVVIEYPFGSWQGRNTHKRVHRAGILEVFEKTQHGLTNPVIHVDGDSATAEYLVHTAHILNSGGTSKIVFGGSIYQQDLIRTAEGWRICKHVCKGTWVDDEGGLLAAVGDSVSRVLKDINEK